MIFKRNKPILLTLPLMLTTIFLSCREQNNKRSQLNSDSTPSCSSSVIDTERIHLIIDNLITQSSIEKASKLSSSEITNYRPDLEMGEIENLTANIRQFAAEPTETTQLLAEVKDHLGGLSHADETSIRKASTALASLQKFWQDEFRILARTEIYGFWGEKGLSFPQFYSLVDEKLASFNLVTAIKDFYRDSFNLQDFITNNPSLKAFRNWVIDSSSGGEIEPKLREAITRALVTSGEISKNQITEEMIWQSLNHTKKYFSGIYLEGSKDDADIVLGILDYYIKQKPVFESVGEISSYLDKLLSETGKKWKNSMFAVDDDVDEGVKPLIPFLYNLRTSISNPVKSKTPDDILQAEKELVWKFIQHDLLFNPTKQLIDDLGYAYLSRIKEAATLARMYSYGGMIKSRDVLKQINDNIDSLSDSRMKRKLREFVNLCKILASAGLMSAPVWVPVAIILTIIPNQRDQGI